MLALDGGGVRGMVTLGFLEELERLLRERHQRPDLRLCDYFDLIGGTSVGSTMAAGLAIGMEVAELREVAEDMLKVFTRKRMKVWHSLFSAAPLQAELAKAAKGRTLDDPFIETGLCVITKRADTRSTWPVTNHPNGRYFEHNRRIKLQDLVYASAAAPLFFVPTRVEVGEGEVGAFVDGGVGMSNNPALQLFLMATLDGYPFHWDKGEDNLLLVSIGTGRFERRDRVEKVMKARAWNWTREVPTMMIEDANSWNQLFLQLLSRSPTPWVIDDEVGNLERDLIVAEPALSYLRYDALMTPAALAEIGVPELGKHVGRLENMTNFESRHDLLDIGRRFAERQVQSEHFPHGFDLITPRGAAES
jgi:patatin-like phospholipase/acyl hydrolase